MSIIKRCIELGIKVTPHDIGVAKTKNDIDPFECIECGEYLPDDERVKAGMKCGYCAYGNGGEEIRNINPDDIRLDA